MRPSKLLFRFAKHAPTDGEGYDVATLLPPVSVIISWQQGMETYKTRAGRQRSSGHRKCTERTVGALNPPDVGVFCLKQEDFFWSGLDVWVCSWWIAQLENWEIIHIALGLKVLIGEGNAHGRGREATHNQCGHGKKRASGERTKDWLVGNLFWLKVFPDPKPFSL